MELKTMKAELDFEPLIDTSDMDVCMACGGPLSGDGTTFEEVLGNDAGWVYLPDGGSMDVPAFKDLRARALTVASVLEEGDTITAQGLFRDWEWDIIGKDYGHLMDRGLAFLADLVLIPFDADETPAGQPKIFVFTGGDED
jgi:hypothetical protein